MICQQCGGQANFEIGINSAIILFWQTFKNILPKNNFLKQLEIKSQLLETRFIFIAHKTRFYAEVGNPPFCKIKVSGHQ
jgi:hypothetical protein